MEFDWGEADPDNLLGVLRGYTVQLDGTDVVVIDLTREGMRVRTWDDERNVADPKSDRLVAWESIGRLFVY
jgi:hypothetical protein